MATVGQTNEEYLQANAPRPNKNYTYTTDTVFVFNTDIWNHYKQNYNIALFYSSQN